MMILNLTQHPATTDQMAAGVVDLAGDELASLKAALTFDALPSEQDVRGRAAYVAELAVVNGLARHGDDDPAVMYAMIGGALFLMAPLVEELADRGIEALFAFSVRETEEQSLADGSVRKSMVFRHAGFVPAVRGGRDHDGKQMPPGHTRA